MSMYLWIDDEQHGPYELEQVRQWLQAGELDGQTLAWREGLEDWVALEGLMEPAAADGAGQDGGLGAGDAAAGGDGDFLLTGEDEEDDEENDEEDDDGGVAVGGQDAARGQEEDAGSGSAAPKLKVGGTGGPKLKVGGAAGGPKLKAAGSGGGAGAATGAAPRAAGSATDGVGAKAGEVAMQGSLKRGMAADLTGGDGDGRGAGKAGGAGDGEKMETAGIVAFVLSLLGLGVIGIFFGIVHLRRGRRHVLGWIGTIFSALQVLLAIVTVVMLFIAGKKVMDWWQNEGFGRTPVEMQQVDYDYVTKDGEMVTGDYRQALDGVVDWALENEALSPSDAVGRELMEAEGVEMVYAKESVYDFSLEREGVKRMFTIPDAVVKKVNE